jgi:DNA-binding MarR family transcriptional regulator
LEKAGWVVQKPDPQDGRRSVISTTEKADDIKPELLQLWEDIDSEMLAGFTQSEVSTLIALLKRLHQNLN